MIVRQILKRYALKLKLEKLCLLYRPPSKRVESFLLDFKNLFSFKKIESNFAMVGDVKIDTIKNKSSLPVNQNIKNLTSFGLKVQNVEPTTDSKISKTSIDHLITKRKKS